MPNLLEYCEYLDADSDDPYADNDYSGADGDDLYADNDCSGADGDDPYADNDCSGADGDNPLVNKLSSNSDASAPDAVCTTVSAAIAKTANPLTNDFPDIILPESVTLSAIIHTHITLGEEVILGVLRKGHKMLVAGPSKSGKSFLAVELALALASGMDWLGLPCTKRKILYINCEIAHDSMIQRFKDVSQRLGLSPEWQNIELWSLRGYSYPLATITNQITAKAKAIQAEVIILDPIYKLMHSDENSAKDTAAFFNRVDYIAVSTGCSMVLVHHHSKGGQGNKDSLDRASGSGVFARDPDAYVDIDGITIPKELEGVKTAWRLTLTLREFQSVAPISCWFSDGIHKVDHDLDNVPLVGTRDANLTKSSKRNSKDEKETAFEKAFQENAVDGKISIGVLAKHLGCCEQTVLNRIKESEGGYRYDSKAGVVVRTEDR